MVAARVCIIKMIQWVSVFVCTKFHFRDPLFGTCIHTQTHSAAGMRARREYVPEYATFMHLYFMCGYRYDDRSQPIVHEPEMYYTMGAWIEVLLHMYAQSSLAMEWWHRTHTQVYGLLCVCLQRMRLNH